MQARLLQILLTLDAGMLPLFILIGAKLEVYILEVTSNSLLTSKTLYGRM